MDKTHAENIAALDKVIDALPTKQGALIGVLHAAQDIFGYLPENVQLHVAKKLEIPSAKVNGVVSFYSFFHTKPRGKYRVDICMGTACFILGADAILKEFEKQLNVKSGETDETLMFTLSALRCVGTCGLAPVVIVNEKVYGRIGVEDVRGIVDDCLAMEHEEEEV
jgi:NADH-quinone oxidoreductase subunit E